MEPFLKAFDKFFLYTIPLLLILQLTMFCASIYYRKLLVSNLLILAAISINFISMDILDGWNGYQFHDYLKYPLLIFIITLFIFHMRLKKHHDYDLNKNIRYALLTISIISVYGASTVYLAVSLWNTL